MDEARAAGCDFERAARAGGHAATTAGAALDFVLVAAPAAEGISDPGDRNHGAGAEHHWIAVDVLHRCAGRDSLDHALQELMEVHNLSGARRRAAQSIYVPERLIVNSLGWPAP